MDMVLWRSLENSLFFSFFTGIFSNQRDPTGRLQTKLKLQDPCRPQYCIKSKTVTWTAIQYLPAPQLLKIPRFCERRGKGKKKAPPSFAQPADSKIARKGTAADLTIPILRMEGGQRHSNMSSITFWGRVKDGKKHPNKAPVVETGRDDTAYMLKSMWEGKERNWLRKSETQPFSPRETQHYKHHTDDFASAVTTWFH